MTSPLLQNKTTTTTTTTTTKTQMKQRRNKSKNTADHTLSLVSSFYMFTVPVWLLTNAARLTSFDRCGKGFSWLGTCFFRCCCHLRSRLRHLTVASLRSRLNLRKDWLLWFFGLQQLATISSILLVTYPHLVRSGATLAYACAWSPSLLSWKLHTNCFSRTQRSQWLSMTIVILLLLLFHTI